MCIEFRQLEHKWILLGCYKPPNKSDLEFNTSITKIVDCYLQKLENLLNTHLNDLLQTYDLTALIKEPT